MTIKISKTRKKTFATLIFMLLTYSVFAQTNVSGRVCDQYGDTMIGVMVIVKNTTKGVVTDLDGNYSIPGVNTGDVLVFSYMGYNTAEIKIADKTIINVTLLESSIALGQVVVVGYGQQKKVNLTGAVAAVNVDEKMSGRSIANTSTALQGLVPGLTVTQSSGMAGNNSAEILIRGMGTINNSAPLIVVDDMPDVDINRINMEDIESISVLKDAAASSIYGSRGANGVILIKTKSGKGAQKTRITFSGSYGFEKPIRSYSFLSDYAQALEVHRTAQAATNIAETNQQYQKGTVDQWMALSMIDEKKYPNTDWWDLIMRTGTMRNYNVSATSGNDVSNFYASIGYLKQEGLQINNDYNRYNTRFNFDYKLYENLTAGFRMDGNWSNYTYALANGFTGNGENANMDMQFAIAGIYPYDAALDAYGVVMAVGEDPTAFNPLEYFTNRLKHKDEQQLNGSFYLDWEPIKGLNARIDYSLRYWNNFEKQADMPNQGYNFQTETYEKWYVNESAGISNTSKTGYKTLLNTRLNYNKTFSENHNINALFVYSEEYWYDRYLYAYRADRIHPNLTEIDAALTTTISNAGNSSTEGLRSYIGRFNYNAFDKYLMELNLRVDGSSKFQPGHQYGFFPSASVGWRFSEENFLKPLVRKWMDSGKLRLSYGGLGNNDVARTEQQEILYSNNYILDGEIVKGFVYEKMINPDLTWEKTTVFNAGLDFVFFNSRFSTEFDFYDRLTTGMIMDSQMSNILTGAYEAPAANLGTLRNRGLEGNFTWRDRIRDFNYSVNLNVSYNASRLEKWGEFLDKGNIYVGMPYEFVYGYKDTGIAQSYAEIYDRTIQWAQPGDILFVDVNGDGLVDSNDRVAYTNFMQNIPTTNFGLNIQAEWKGFDLSMLFQGTAGRKDYWITKFNSVNIPVSRYASTEEHVENPWSYDNRDGEWSRLALSSGNQGSGKFWLDNLVYLRMKNLMFGYTLPQKITKKFFINNLRIYYSTENLFTITSYRGLDPEKIDRGDMYPMVSSHSFGITVDL
ncbi:MAG: SusC/RagA family TonB-linked outer membrane protein [Paludibacteraceae bacterium]